MIVILLLLYGFVAGISVVSPININGVQLDVTYLYSSSTTNQIVIFRYYKTVLSGSLLIRLTDVDNGGYTTDVILATSASTVTGNITCTSNSESQLTNYYQLNTSCNISTKRVYQLQMWYSNSKQSASANIIQNAIDNKQAFLHTYITISLETQIIMPRTRYRLLLNNHQYNVFVGGAIKSGQSVYFISVLAIALNSSLSVNSWMGFNIGRGHINRDMILYYMVNNTVTVTDAYSLLGMTPFVDTSTNIGGAANIQNIEESTSTGYAYTSDYRLYDTGDTKGDKVIKFKTNQVICLAADESSSSSVLVGDPTSQSTKMHSFSICNPFDISLLGWRLLVLWMVYIIML